MLHDALRQLVGGYAVDDFDEAPSAAPAKGRSKVFTSRISCSPCVPLCQAVTAVRMSSEQCSQRGSLNFIERIRRVMSRRVDGSPTMDWDQTQDSHRPDPMYDHNAINKPKTLPEKVKSGAHALIRAAEVGG